MIDLAYVQREDHGEFLSDATYTFWRGCYLLGIETIAFRQPDIETIELRKETLVHGGIGMVRKAFGRLGVPQPHLHEVPPAELLPFYGRNMWATTMAEVRRHLEEDRHIFIKPLRRQKAFTGHVTSGSVGDLIKTAGFENTFEILASDVVNFVVEYRLFVHKGEIIGCRHYRGDFRKPLDFSVADAFVAAFKDPPVAYSLDLGVTADGATLVVEVNDAFSLGSYGLGPVPYARLVIDRWEEIVGL